MTDVNTLKRALLSYYAPTGPERVGFVLEREIVEVPNVCQNPEEGFAVNPLDVILYTEEQKALATWHTHPGVSSNLSGEDFKTFKAYPQLAHFVVGKDGVRCYKYSTEKKTILEVLDNESI